MRGLRFSQRCCWRYSWIFMLSSGMYFLFTDQEMIRAVNKIHAQAPDFVVNDELLLLPILRTFSQCTHYTLHEILDFFFQSVIAAECSVAATSSIPLIPTIECSLPHRARHNPPPLPRLRGSCRVLWCVLTF